MSLTKNLQPKIKQKMFHRRLKDMSIEGLNSSLAQSPEELYSW